jgi:hypothetical protein
MNSLVALVRHPPSSEEPDETPIVSSRHRFHTVTAMMIQSNVARTGQTSQRTPQSSSGTCQRGTTYAERHERAMVGEKKGDGPNPSKVRTFQAGNTPSFSTTTRQSGLAKSEYTPAHCEKGTLSYPSSPALFSRKGRTRCRYHGNRKFPPFQAFRPVAPNHSSSTTGHSNR